jgi:hypothetical protein
MSAHEKLAAILKIPPEVLARLDAAMVRVGRPAGVLDTVANENDARVDNTLHLLNSNLRSAPHVRSILRKTILSHEKQFLGFLETVPGGDEFARAAALARRIVPDRRGWFLKKEKASAILAARPPEHVLGFLGLSSVSELLARHDVTEVFAALRFMESDEWMHETFERTYSSFTPDDFEERELVIEVLGPAWRESAKRFVAHKHHNVSHLKEFGVIFINPLEEQVPGKFLRDFALILHYCHEIRFYSKLFRQYAAGSDFAERLKALLRGDVPAVSTLNEGEWLIIQRYLAKDNPSDARLALPHVNPESFHWSRGERDFANFTGGTFNPPLNLWSDLDWVGGVFDGGDGAVVSFDLEDNAMSLVSFMEGKGESFNYHQGEALWTKLFMAYVGGEEEAERLLLKHFDRGIVPF